MRIWETNTLHGAFGHILFIGIFSIRFFFRIVFHFKAYPEKVKALEILTSNNGNMRQKCRIFTRERKMNERQNNELYHIYRKRLTTKNWIHSLRLIGQTLYGHWNLQKEKKNSGLYVYSEWAGFLSLPLSHLVQGHPSICSFYPNGIAFVSMGGITLISKEFISQPRVLTRR